MILTKSDGLEIIDLKLLGYQIKNDLICNFVRWQQNQL